MKEIKQEHEKNKVRMLTLCHVCAKKSDVTDFPEVQPVCLDSVLSGLRSFHFDTELLLIKH